MSQTLRIGIAGLGTVGVSVLQLLRRQHDALKASTGRDIRVVAVSARNRARDRGIDLSGIEWYDDPVEIASSDDVDLFVELMGGD